MSKKTKQNPTCENYLDNLCAVAYQQGFKLSVLVDNPLPDRCGKGKESYVGKVFGYDKDFLVLDLNYNRRVRRIILRKSFILSVWIYQD